MKPEHFALLKNKFPGNEFALLDEVSDEAGFSRKRSADAIAFGLWPSRGHPIHGIEVKSGRGDWLKEMKNPAKQESIFKYCNHFWLCATNEDVVHNISEIPKNWGYLLIKGDRIHTKKDAPILKPKALSMSFTAALLKRATGRMIHPAEIENKIQARLKEDNYSIRNDLEKAKNELKNIKDYIAEFEKASGLDFGSKGWRSDDDAKLIGLAVKEVLMHERKTEWYYQNLERSASELKKVYEEINKIISLHKPHELIEIETGIKDKNGEPITKTKLKKSIRQSHE